jgi:hypothetical protein
MDIIRIWDRSHCLPYFWMIAHPIALTCCFATFCRPGDGGWVPSRYDENGASSHPELFKARGGDHSSRGIYRFVIIRRNGVITYRYFPQAGRIPRGDRAGGYRHTANDGRREPGLA